MIERERHGDTQITCKFCGSELRGEDLPILGVCILCEEGNYDKSFPESLALKGRRGKKV